MTPLSPGTRAFVALAALMTCTPALLPAQVTMSTGTGSAVTRTDASASFESQAAVNGNPYVESGLTFTRTGLSGNQCGFAGCKPPFDYFPGNYMYGSSAGAADGYFSIFAPAGQLFSGLEFIAGNGFGDDETNVVFRAFLNGARVGSGSSNVPTGAVVGFSGGAGFNELQYTDDVVASFGFHRPAFDEVRVQFVVIPEPGSLILLATGLLGVYGVARARQRGITHS